MEKDNKTTFEQLRSENENDVIFCKQCGSVIYDKDAAIEIDGNYYCDEDCAESAGYVICEYCGAIIRKDEDKETEDGGYICDDCASEHYRECNNCGRYIYRGNEHWITDRYGDDVPYCDACFDDCCYKCDICGEWHDYNEINYIEGYYYGDYSTICDNCASDLHLCPYCDNYVNDDDWDYCEGCCCSCAEEQEDDGGGLIGEYHERPVLVFYGDEDKYKLFSGLELEIDNGRRNSECAQALLDIAGDYIYFNYDGSLDNGFEIISQPATAREFYKQNWSKILSTCVDYGYQSHDAGTCGLHVHLSRRGFGKTHKEQDRAIAKLVRFYDVFFDELLKVSRRNQSQIRDWAAPYYTRSNKEAKEIVAAPRYDRSRYHAVNLQNYDTIEIRLMRGTLNPETFFATYDFIIRTAINARRIKWADVENASKWLAGIKPETRKYLIERGAFSAALAA